jgi:Fe-S-cluster containining protein
LINVHRLQQGTNMSPSDPGREVNPQSDVLATWGVDALRRNLFQRLRRLARQEGLALTAKRVAHEIEQDPYCRRLLERWPAPECDRESTWQELMDSGARACRNVSPICVRCGECCRNASPILYSPDLLAVRRERIPLKELMALRIDEPASSPFADKPFPLSSECIKVREKPGSSECVFFDSEHELCGIHEHRPYQCQAQSCWDESGVEGLMSLKVLTRRELFSGVDALLEIMDDHDRRCSFAKLVEAFEELHKSQGATLDDVVELIAYEDHFRSFVAERMGLPEDALDLFFGRSLASRVRLFGFRVDEGVDGSRTLVAENAASPSPP